MIDNLSICFWNVNIQSEFGGCHPRVQLCRSPNLNSEVILQWASRAPDGQMITLSVCIFWQIWLARNRLLWEGIQVKLTVVVREAYNG